VLVVRPATRVIGRAAEPELRLAECPHCGVGAPQLHPGAPAGTGSPR
jgi:hypothetical protein